MFLQKTKKNDSRTHETIKTKKIKDRNKATRKNMRTKST